MDNNKELEPMDIFAKIQPLLQNFFNTQINEYASKNLTEGSNIPVHAHTGIDTSPPVDYFSLLNSPQILLTRQITLSPTQIKALKDTPITLVPSLNLRAGQTSYQIIVPVTIDAYISYNGTAYTGVNSLEFRYTNASGNKCTFDIPSTFINSISSTYFHTMDRSTISGPPVFAPTAGAPVVVCVPAANPAAGTSAITFFIRYYIATFKP